MQFNEFKKEMESSDKVICVSLKGNTVHIKYSNGVGWFNINRSDKMAEHLINSK